jgi:hypothetical protein
MFESGAAVGCKAESVQAWRWRGSWQLLWAGRLARSNPQSMVPKAAHKETQATHVAKHDADKQVQRDAEYVDNGGAQLLGHVVRPQLHHRRPEHAHAGLKHAKGDHLHLPSQRDGLALQLWRFRGTERV